jgi:hypothetical protein
MGFLRSLSAGQHGGFLSNVSAELFPSRLWVMAFAVVHDAAIAALPLPLLSLTKAVVQKQPQAIHEQISTPQHLQIRTPRFPRLRSDPQLRSSSDKRLFPADVLLLSECGVPYNNKEPCPGISPSVSTRAFHPPPGVSVEHAVERIGDTLSQSAKASQSFILPAQRLASAFHLYDQSGVGAAFGVAVNADGLLAGQGKGCCEGMVDLPSSAWMKGRCFRKAWLA